MPPDRWLELTLRSSTELEQVCPVFLDLGVGALEERGDTLITHLPPPPDVNALLARILDSLNKSFPDAHFDLSWRWQPQEDWETLWRTGLGPRRITERLIVAPSWESVVAGPGEMVLTLDPGMAFGTAEHATTRGCLRLLDSVVEVDSWLADVGSGSGILSIAAVLLGARGVLALEMDEMSCETAAENLLRNQVADRVEIRQTQVKGGPPLPEAPFDGIVANLQSHLILPLLSSFQKSLVPDGWLILSGILQVQRSEVLSAAGETGFSLVRDDGEEDWWTGLFRGPPFLG